MYLAQQLGRYHLLDRIAFGGMAEIFRAKTFDSKGNEHLVAIKRVLRHLAEDDDFLQMLVDEAKLTILLEHANIARVYEFVRAEDEFFIAMEYVDGKDLRSLIDRCRSDERWLPPEDCAYAMIRVLDALHSAHEKRDGAGVPLDIVHRDVSPSNVIVSYQGQVKLCDFGIAKATLNRVRTRTGVIKGKVRYMSPEQALGKPLDRRSDVFSAGSVLYELVTKQCPFQADNEMELIFRVRDAKFTSPRRYNPELPQALEPILRKALARSPSSRYQTAEEFGQALRGYLKEAAPAYRPVRLGRFVRDLFAADIEEDLRRLEEYVVGRGDPVAVGQNLLAEVLGEGAPYTRFTPVAPRPDELPEAKTKLLPRVPPPETRLPEGANLHELRTQILDPAERGQRVHRRKARPRPGALHEEERQRPTEVRTNQLPPDRPPLDPVPTPAPGDPSFHDAPTRIIRRDG
ncbi:MAG: serine/threonine protein kinase [Deltaproteobacteria bacterium]|nr:serine/threonine protein kinase [Deltaproteobacteria bacterium]